MGSRLAAVFESDQAQVRMRPDASSWPFHTISGSAFPMDAITAPLKVTEAPVSAIDPVLTLGEDAEVRLSGAGRLPEKIISHRGLPARHDLLDFSSLTELKPAQSP